MNKQRPSALAMVTMVAFTASCIGLLIFLWVSFGGSLPFNAQGYRFSVQFSQATELASNAEVEIAGVKVGHVVSVRLDRQTGLSRAVLEINHQYAPRPADTHAILRAKTLLGETYVQLSPGNPKAAKLRDGAALPQGQVSGTVQLDQILDTFDPKTRQAFQTWMQQGGIALTNRGEQFNEALAELDPFATNVTAVLAVLHREGVATSTLLSDGGQVFSSLSKEPAQLQSFVRNTNQTFAATASRDQDLADAIRNFPALLTQARTSLGVINGFAKNTKPLVDELHPAAIRLAPALRRLTTLAPELKTLVTDLGPLSTASRTGLPALRSFLTQSVPFLKAVRPYLGNLIPVIDYINKYRRELAAFFANSTAATQAQTGSENGGNAHYLRISNPINPEALATYQSRPSSNRSNPYMTAGGYAKLLKGLDVFGSYLCTDNPLATIDPSLSYLGSGTTSVAGTVLTIAQLVQQYYYTADPSGPACKAQEPLGKSTTGQNASFPSLTAKP